MSLIKIDRSEIGSEISPCYSNYMNREGKPTRDGPKAFALVASGSVFIAESTETSTSVLTGQAVDL